MIVLDVWALAVLAGCVWIAQRHGGQRGWTGAVIVVAVAVVSLLGETVVAGKSAGLGEALLLIAPALGSVFIALPYLTVAAALVTVGPRITARARPLAARPWLWSILGWVVWTVLLSPTIGGQVIR